VASGDGEEEDDGDGGEESGGEASEQGEEEEEEEEEEKEEDGIEEKNDEYLSGSVDAPSMLRLVCLVARSGNECRALHKACDGRANVPGIVRVDAWCGWDVRRCAVRANDRRRELSIDASCAPREAHRVSGLYERCGDDPHISLLHLTFASPASCSRGWRSAYVIRVWLGLHRFLISHQMAE